MSTIITCEHEGEHCDGAEFCTTCHVQIFSGYKDADERYCNDHKPATWDAEVAAMSSEEFDNQDDMYWTQWEICDIFCDCPADCPCRPSPEALQALYDADRARSKAENDAINAKTYTITQAQLILISDALRDAEGLMESLTEGPDDNEFVEYSRLEAVSKASAEVDSILYMVCELCGDRRLEEDLNEDLRCPPCEEREEKNENFDSFYPPLDN